MSELGLATVTLLASLVLTYFFCIRPMSKGHCAMTPKVQSQEQSPGSVDREGEIARLRAEVDLLRAEMLSRESGLPLQLPAASGGRRISLASTSESSWQSAPTTDAP